MKYTLLLLLAIWVTSVVPSQAQSAYAFGNGSITWSTTQNYLKRSGMVSGMLAMYPCASPSPAATTERAAFESFLQAAHPKMLLGTGLWTTEQYLIRDIDNCHFPRCAQAAAAIHALDSDILLGASLDEVVCQSVNAREWQITVPADLLTTYNSCVASIQRNHPAYGCTPLAFSVPTYFDYTGIAADNPVRLGDYGYEVDITKPLAQLWYFYLAKHYIDSGFEMLRLGQFQLTAAQESASGYPKTFQLTRVIREYAKLHARRGVVLFDVQSASPYFVPPAPATGQLPVFDICGLPTRLHSRNAVLRSTGLDANGAPTTSTAQDYEVLLSEGASGKPDWATIGGGQTDYWGTVGHLPVYVELDNTGDKSMWATKNPSGLPPAENNDGNPNGGFPWGWDECTWFYNQSLVFESQSLAALYTQVQCLTDRNGTFCLPLKRPYFYYDSNGKKQDSSFDVYNSANPNFRDLSQSIKSIWDQNAPGATTKTAFNTWPNALPTHQSLPFSLNDPKLVTLAYLDSDGREDILYRNPGTSTLDIYLSSNGTNQFAYAGAVAGLGVGDPGNTPSFNSRITVGDFNNDGFDDLLLTANKAAGEYYTTYQVYLNNHTATPSFTAGSLSYNGPSWGERIYVGDFNGDGFDDLLATADRQLLSNAWGGYRTYLNKGLAYGVPDLRLPSATAQMASHRGGNVFL